MEKRRFSLLLLSPDETYFEDFSCTVYRSNGIKLPGRLKLCSKSLIFEAHTPSAPILKIFLSHCPDINGNGNTHTIRVLCQQYATIFDENRIGPYNFHYKTEEFVFCFNYAPIDDCLQLILQLQRACTLPPHDEKAMISAISHSKRGSLKFNLKWLEDMEEKILMQTEANKISPLVVNPGRIVLTASHVYFQPFNNAENYPVLKINLKRISQLKLRRFLQRHVGLEVFWEGTCESHIYLSFPSAESRNRFHALLLAQSAVNFPQISPEVVTLKWQNHAISNFEYLQYINSLADRSFNDLTQYPIFPWVINDYTSPQLNLEDDSVYRDLKKPIGALNEERLRRLREREKSMSGPKYLYGSHYSTPAFVLFYLVRQHPELMLCLQNGRFDHADRLFHSVADVWRNVLGNTSDFKELIPQFYDPNNGGDFLLNKLKLDLGTRYDGRSVHDVVLPPWCDSAQHFVQILRRALESNYVSENLPAWIDLIFGFKQQGIQAKESNNVFHPICYEGAVNLDEMHDLNERHALEVQIMEFGQIPKNIFQVPHPPRLALRPPSPFPFFDLNRLFSCRGSVFVEHRDAVTCLAYDGDIVYSVSKDSVLKELNANSVCEERSFYIEAIGIAAVAPLPGCKITLLGTFDNRILVYDVERATVIDEVRAHEDAISALQWNSRAHLLLSASSDGSMLLWPLECIGNTLPRLIKCRTTRFDHDSKVTAACLSRTGKLAACGTDEGDMFVYKIAQASRMFHWCRKGDPITAITVANDESKIISTTKLACLTHDLVSGLLVYEISQDIPTTSLCWLSDKILVLADNGGSLHFLDLDKVEFIGKLNTGVPLPITSVLVNQAMYICCAQGNQVFIFKA